MSKDRKTNVSHMRRAKSVLEKRVQKRTENLAEVNEALQAVIAERRRAEQETRLLLSIMQAVCDCEDFNSAIRVTLEQVCQATGWQYGEAWIPRSDGTALECSPVWHARSKGYEKFRGISEELTFAPGVGLPGRVWDSKRPEWIKDVSSESDKVYVRVASAKAAGLKAALGVPIIIGHEVLAVVVFYQLEPRALDQRLVELVTGVGTHLGSVMSHKRTDQALEESQGLLSAIMDNSSRVIYLKDREGRYLLINTEYEKLFHVDRDDIKGKTDYDLFPKEFADAFRTNDLKVVKAGTPMDFEEVVHQDDGIHTYLSNKFPMFNALGYCYSVCGISTDITDQKRTEKQIERSRDKLEEDVRKRTADLTKMVKDLNDQIVERKKAEGRLRESERLAAIGATTAKVAHEIGNPLNGMYLSLQLLEQQLKSQDNTINEKVSSTLARLKNEIVRLNKLVSDFRSIARRERYNFRPTAIASVVREALAIEMQNFSASGINVETEISPSLPSLIGDVDRLKQLLLNLIKNAGEAMLNGGTLTLKAHPTEDGIAIEVSDTGIGIPDDIVVFDPFTTTKRQGTGMGLMVARQIVAAHGGQINYTSSPNRGTTFLVTLPLVPPNAESDQI